MRSVVPFDGSKRLLNQLLAPLHILRIPSNHDPNLCRLLRPSQAVVRLKAWRKLLKRIGGISIPVNSHDVCVVPDADRLRVPGVRTAVRACTACFPASVHDSVLTRTMPEQLPAHRAGDCSVLMPDEAAHHTALLKLYRDTPRQMRGHTVTMGFPSLSSRGVNPAAFPFL